MLLRARRRAARDRQAAYRKAGSLSGQKRNGDLLYGDRCRTLTMFAFVGGGNRRVPQEVLFRGGELRADPYGGGLQGTEDLAGPP